MPALAAEAIEEAIVRIAAVDAARVVVVDDIVREIHIVANRSRPAKHIGRDVQSLLAATWGVDLDQRAVSVVQLGGADVDLVQAAAPVADRRAKTELGTVTVTFDGDSSTATVEVSVAGRLERGMSVGAPTLLRRLVASATLDALRRLVDGGDLLLGDQAGLAQHGGVGARTGQVLGGQAPVDADGDVDRLHQGVGSAGETAAPHRLPLGLALSLGLPRTRISGLCLPVLRS